MPRTLAEKILGGPTDADSVSPGEIVMVLRDLVTANDVSGPAVFHQVEKMSAKKVLDPKIGLPIIAQANAAAAARLESEIHIDMDSGGIEVDGERFASEPLPQFIQSMISSGGLSPWGHQKLSNNHGSVRNV